MKAVESAAAEVFGRLVMEWLPEDKLWQLVEPLEVRWRSIELTVPAGTRSDLDSVPRAPLIYLMFKGLALRAAWVHDWLYQHPGPYDRMTADGLFYVLAIAEDVPERKAAAMYHAVRVHGKASWDRHRAAGARARSTP